MRKRLILLPVLAAFVLTGCAETKPVSQQDQVSTIPWNRPESWEGQGPLGGFTGSR